MSDLHTIVDEIKPEYVNDKDLIIRCSSGSGDEEIQATLTAPAVPEKSLHSLLLLTHGTGSDHHLPQLTLLAHGITQAAPHGWGILRFTRRGTNVDRIAEVYAGVITFAASNYPGVKTIIIGGRSMGCRAAVIAMNDHNTSDLVKGIICLAYPLHKPGTSELRDKPLFQCPLPMLFVSGTKDSFAKSSLLEDVVKKMPQSTLEWIEGGDHSYVVKGRTVEDVCAQICGVVKRWCEKLFDNQ